MQISGLFNKIKTTLLIGGLFSARFCMNVMLYLLLNQVVFLIHF